MFQTSSDFTIPPARPVAYVVERGGAVKDVAVGRGVGPPARRRPARRSPAPPRPGDALYLGFDEPLARLLLRVDVDCSQARGAGVDPEDPPLRWEVSTGERALGGARRRARRPHRRLQLRQRRRRARSSRPRTGVQPSAGTAAHWIRCRVDRVDARRRRRRRLHAPAGDLLDHRRADRRALPADARRARRRRAARRERRHARPDASAAPPPAARARRRRDARGAQAPSRATGSAWQRVESFAESGPRRPPLRARRRDRHGRARPGDPRAPTAAGRQYGAMPPKGAQLRISRLPPRRRPRRQRRRRAR